ncbi:hypothetical protein HK105_206060 [Polyrhizophydium stewartii]|uniref:Uncharacterized protein n=1 Tax=Polyrhizophydium stewartii TaxID=2732419 RepID=A0ABR4N4Q2_9FUNG
MAKNAASKAGDKQDTAGGSGKAAGADKLGSVEGSGEQAVATRLQGPQILSSLPFQILLFLNTYYFPIVWLMTLALLVYKGYVFQFATAAYPMEVFVLFPWAMAEASRIFMGKACMGPG